MVYNVLNDRRGRVAAVRVYGRLSVYLINIPKLCGGDEVYTALSIPNIFKIRIIFIFCERILWWGGGGVQYNYIPGSSWKQRTLRELFFQPGTKIWPKVSQLPRNHSAEEGNVFLRNDTRPCQKTSW